MACYTIQTDSLQIIGKVKVGLMITLTDEVNGKPDLTHYHEVESTDPVIIDEVLSQLAQEYEDRLEDSEEIMILPIGVMMKVSKDSLTGRMTSEVIKGVVKEEIGLKG